MSDSLIIEIVSTIIVEFFLLTYNFYLIHVRIWPRYCKGNYMGSDGTRSWGHKVLLGASMDCNYLSIMFRLGSNWNHFLRFVFAIWYFNYSSILRDRDLGCYFLQRKFSSRKRSCSCTLFGDLLPTFMVS